MTRSEGPERHSGLAQSFRPDGAEYTGCPPIDRSPAAQAPVPHREAQRKEAQMSAPTEPNTSTAVTGAVPPQRTKPEPGAIRPFRVEIPEAEILELRRRVAATRWPSHELVADRSQGVRLATMQELVRYWLIGLRPAPGRDEAERAAAVHDRDRRGGDPLRAREVAARERVAADHDARLARLGDRAARLGRPAHRPDRVRRHRRGRLRPGPAVAARLRLLRRADRGRLGPRPHRSRLGRVDAPPGLHPLRGAGRRRRRRRHRRDGPPGTRGAGRASTPTCSCPR